MPEIDHMKSCLELAYKAAGRTSPNPMVGAVVVDEGGAVVGRGYHLKAGTAHAEVHAIQEAGDKAKGATMYVSLEPCCHQGRTGPCAEAVVAAGIKHVVIGMRDPNPKVAGGGIKRLNDAGITTEVGLLEQECRWLNRAFIKRMETGLPWVCLKLATTLDGKIADREGTSRWITGKEARYLVHQLRNEYDAVMVGSHTALKDDPQLNVRELEGSRDPVRVIIDSQLQVKPSAKVCQADLGGPTIIFCGGEAFTSKSNNYPANVKLIPVESVNGRLNLKAALEQLVAQDVLSVLCEGGSRLAGALTSAKLVDEIHWLIAPKVMGDPEAISAIQGEGAVSLNEAVQLGRLETSQIGQDVLIHAVLNPNF